MNWAAYGASPSAKPLHPRSGGNVCRRRPNVRLRKKWREQVDAPLKSLCSPLHNLTKILLNQMASSEGTEDGWCGETLVVTYV